MKERNDLPPVLDGKHDNATEHRLENIEKEIRYLRTMLLLLLGGFLAHLLDMLL